MRTVTLQQLRVDVQNQADIAGLTTRHGATLINRIINQEIQHFREDLSGEGSRHFLQVATGTMLQGATSGFPFRELNAGALASGIVRVYGLDVKCQGGEWKRLEHTTFEDRTSYGGPNSLGEPKVWAEYQTTRLAVLPAPNQNYDFILWYLPVLNDLANDSDTFDGVAGWEDYIMWAAVARLVMRDQFPQTFAMVMQCKAEAMQKILRSSTRVTTAGGATIGRDSMGARGLFRRRGGRGMGDDGRIFDDSFDDSFG